MGNIMNERVIKGEALIEKITNNLKFMPTLGRVIRAMENDELAKEHFPAINLHLPKLMGEEWSNKINCNRLEFQIAFWNVFGTNVFCSHCGGNPDSMAENLRK